MSLKSTSQGPHYTESYGILPGDSAGKALHKILTKQAARMAYYQPGAMIGEDIEDLHKMRVATRRMRAALRVHKPYLTWEASKPHYKWLRQLGKTLGPVRDLDVFLLNFKEERVDAVYSGIEGSDQFLDEIGKIYHQEREGMATYLGSEEYVRAFKEFEDYLKSGELAGQRQTEPVGKIVVEMMENLYEIVCSFEPIEENEEPVRLHKMRIRIKELRYTIEFYQELFPESRWRMIERLKRLQDYLGEMNDVRVALGILGNIEGREKQMEAFIQNHQDVKWKKMEVLVRGFPGVWADFRRSGFLEELKRMAGE